MTPIEVSYRDGKYNVVNGQHRLAAMRRMNGGEDLVARCLVYTGMTYEQEAAMYYLLDKTSGHLKLANAIKALLESGTDPEIIDIRQRIERAGFTWALDKPTGVAYEIKPEIDPEEAKTVKLIYERFLAGDSMRGIVEMLDNMDVPTPGGQGKGHRSTVCSILQNERYKGDAIINKTYVVDCLSKKVKRNDGQARPKYYVENNHPAIIDAATFGRVQEELARRTGKRKVKQKGTKTELGRYSSKYALTELLVCGECGTPYRRCTWTVKGERKPVWRCINRLDFGKKYCHHSPTMEETVLQEAIVAAIMRTAKQSANVLGTLKIHIGMGLKNDDSEDNSLDIQIRIAEIDAEFKTMLQSIATDTVEDFDEQRATALMAEKNSLEQQLAQYDNAQQEKENTESRLDEIFTILDGLENHPMEYDDRLVRQVLECVVVESKEKLKVIFAGGLEVEQTIPV